MTTPKPPSQPGCLWLQECIEECNGDTVFVEDEGVRATFRNPNHDRIRKIRYDACYYKGKGRQADFILGLPEVIDVILELKNSDTNIKDAALQVATTFERWRDDPIAAKKIAGLIIYGRIEGKKKLPGRVPRASAVINGLRADFFRNYQKLLLIHENGAKQFRFDDFLKKTND
jgi:hypothetical protein